MIRFFSHSSTNVYVLVFPWSFAKSTDLFDRDCLITYHSPSTKVIAVMIFTEYWWPL